MIVGLRVSGSSMVDGKIKCLGDASLEINVVAYLNMDVHFATIFLSKKEKHIKRMKGCIPFIDYFKVQRK